MEVGIKIRAKKFILRSPRKEDMDSLWENYNDKDVAKNMVNMETEKEFKREYLDKLKKKDKSTDNFVVEIDGKAVGMVTIREIIPKLKGIISSWIGNNYRGKGVMTRAKIIVCKYWYKKYKLKRIEARTRNYNKAAQRSLEKSGFKLEGILKKNVLKNGKYYDDYLYARVIS
jgi:[ribosomal protein S5]-alanine N-acetyltransferase